jgi:hypothetical protein
VGEELEDKLVEWVRTPHSVLGRTPYVVSAEYVRSGYGVGKEWVRSMHVVYIWSMYIMYGVGMEWVRSTEWVRSRSVE